MRNIILGFWRSLSKGMACPIRAEGLVEGSDVVKVPESNCQREVVDTVEKGEPAPS